MSLVTFQDLPNTTTPLNASNLNNNFNELNNSRNYSTGEQEIGRWINGKPLYRKVIQTTLPSNSSDIVITNNMQVGFLEFGYLNSPTSSGARYLPIPWVSNDNATRVTGFVTAYNGSFHLTNEISTYTGFSCYLSFLYTKTTD